MVVYNSIVLVCIYIYSSSIVLNQIKTNFLIPTEKEMIDCPSDTTVLSFGCLFGTFFPEQSDNRGNQFIDDKDMIGL